MSLRKEIVRLAHANPGPLREALLEILSGEESPKTAARKRAPRKTRAPKKTYPRATKRPPAKKFREGLTEWAKIDIQETLEAAGVPQNMINDAIESIAGYNYGVINGTSFSKGYTAQNYQNFATQQEAVDWLAGKARAEYVSGTWGMDRYPDILQAYIERYGAGNDAARNKAQGEWNKLKQHQKALTVALLGYQRASIRYADASIKEMESDFDTMSGERAQKVLKAIQWASKVPMWPEGI
jgi:hypothetical protein